MTTDRILPGVALMLAFCMLAPLLDVSSKLAAATIPVGQITAARFVVQGALMLPVALVMRVAWAVSPRMAGLITLRAIFLILSTYCFVAAIQVMPIADTLAMAERHGTPIAQTLEQLALDVRERRRRQAEADARKLPIRMSFPLVVCTLPSFVLIAIVPAVLAAMASLALAAFSLLLPHTPPPSAGKAFASFEARKAATASG